MEILGWLAVVLGAGVVVGVFVSLALRGRAGETPAERQLRVQARQAELDARPEVHELGSTRLGGGKEPDDAAKKAKAKRVGRR